MDVPNTSLSRLEGCFNTTDVPHTDDDECDAMSLLNEVMQQCNILGNPEQDRAIHIIGKHFLQNKTDQLFIYIAGVGGSGKTHVIHTIVELFTQCGASQEILLSAPTGCAAVLTNGYTIHALTFLPKSKYKPDQNELENIWWHFRYLIIDEISMISAKLFAEISTRICQARSWDPEMSEKPFGGVNMIFTGDFGQLRPVRAASLFSYRLVDVIGPDISQKEQGQTALHGASLWRQVNQVVELKTNIRAGSDQEFVNLLACIRIGRAWDRKHPMTADQLGSGPNYTISDFQTLNSHRFQSLQ